MHRYDRRPSRFMQMYNYTRGLQLRSTMKLTQEDKRARNRAQAAKDREKNRGQIRQRCTEKMQDLAFAEAERVRALERYYRTRPMDVKPLGRPRKHVYTTAEQHARLERASEARLSGEK